MNRPVKAYFKLLLFQALLLFSAAATLNAACADTQQQLPKSTLASSTDKVAPTKKLPEKKLSPSKEKAPSTKDLDNETRAVLQAVGERYKKFTLWEADFTQDNHSVGLGQGQYYKGHFVFESPNKFRYSLTSPEVIEYLCDGKEFWQIQYRDGRDKPAFVREFTDLKKVELDKYLFLLRGIGTLSSKNVSKLVKDFVITGKTPDDELHLILEPRKTTEIIRMTLIFKQNAPALYRATIEDSIGNTTTITLLRHKILDKIDPKVFVPDYPKTSKVEKIE